MIPLGSTQKRIVIELKKGEKTTIELREVLDWVQPLELKRTLRRLKEKGLVSIKGSTKQPNNSRGGPVNVWQITLKGVEVGIVNGYWED